MKVDRQLSFHAGELDPGLHGRIDLDIYRYGSYRLRDFIVTREGNAWNRPGTQHIATLTGLDPTVQGGTRDEGVLFAWERRDPDESFVWCACAGGIARGYKTGSDYRYRFASEVGLPPSFKGPKRFARYGTLGIVTQEHNVAQQWYWDDPYLGRFKTWDARGYQGTVYWPHDLRLGNVVSEFAHRPSLRPTLDDKYDEGFAGNSTNPRKPWLWLVTLIVGLDGRVIETGAFPVGGRASKADPKTVVFGYAPFEGAALSASLSFDIRPGVKKGDTVVLYGAGRGDVRLATVLGFRVYRGKWKLSASTYPFTLPYVEFLYGDRTNSFPSFDPDDLGFPTVGLVGETEEDVFTDDARDPDYSRTPPRGENPFDNNYPKAVTFHDGRLFLGGTSNEPARVWASEVGNIFNFDEAKLALDGTLRADAALDFTPAGKGYNEILDMVSRPEGLLLFTKRGEYIVTGSGDGEVITPSSLRVRSVSYHGCADVPVVEGDDAIFFVQAEGSRVMALTRQGTLDLTVNARHLFKGKTITSIAFAKQPHPVLWAARSDGALLSCTFFGDRGAWTLHNLPGEVFSVATLPEDDEDGVYLVVNYSGTYCLERMAKREFTDIRDAVFLDRSVTYAGKFALPSSITESSGIYTLHLNTTTSITGTGLEDRFVRFDLDDGTFLLFRTVEETGPKIYNAELMAGEVPASMKGAVTNFSSFYLCTDSVTGLNHLEGQDVVALVDGSVVRGLTVSGGSVALPVPGGKVHVGLAYTPEWQSLGIAQDAKQQKAVVEAYVRVKDTLGGVIGETLTSDMLEEIAGREASDGYGALDPKTKEYQVPIESGWGQEGYVAYRQNDPLPVTLVGVTRLYQEGGQ